jgi:hypothetical protein
LDIERAPSSRDRVARSETRVRRITMAKSYASATLYYICCKNYKKTPHVPRIT